jgi:hypothetical protein
MISVSKVYWRSPQPHLAGLGLQATLAVAGAAIATCGAGLVALRIAQPIRLGIEQGVQCFLQGGPHHPLQVALDPHVVNRDDVVFSGLGVSSEWRLPLAGLVAFSEPHFSQIRGRQPYLIVRKRFRTPSRPRTSRNRLASAAPTVALRARR